MYSLEFPNSVDEERLNKTYQAYPWAGGYSAVNFYNNLYYMLPAKDRPTILSMRYSSPGWIELGLALAVAGLIRKHVVKAVLEISSAYTQIHKEMQDRKLLRMDVKERQLKLTRAELEFVLKSSRWFAHKLEFEQLEALNELTGNSLTSLKILLSYYRRIRKLKGYVEKRKLEL